MVARMALVEAGALTVTAMKIRLFMYPLNNVATLTHIPLWLHVQVPMGMLPATYYELLHLLQTRRWVWHGPMQCFPCVCQLRHCLENKASLTLSVLLT